MILFALDLSPHGFAIKFHPKLSHTMRGAIFFYKPVPIFISKWCKTVQLILSWPFCLNLILFCLNLNRYLYPTINLMVVTNLMWFNLTLSSVLFKPIFLTCVSCHSASAHVWFVLEVLAFWPYLFSHYTKHWICPNDSFIHNTMGFSLIPLNEFKYRCNCWCLITTSFKKFKILFSYKFFSCFNV